MATVPTIKVVNWKPGGTGYLIINVSDFDPEVHTRYGEKPSSEKSPEKPSVSEPRKASGQKDPARKRAPRKKTGGSAPKKEES